MKPKVIYAEKALEKLQTRLRKMCHVKGCHRLDSCPERCFVCNSEHPTLDLDTATAWACADQLDNFMDTVSEFNSDLEDFLRHYETFKGGGYYRQSALELMGISMDNLDGLFMNLYHVEGATAALVEVVDFHKDQYNRLFKILCQVDQEVRYAVRKVKAKYDEVKKLFDRVKEREE